MGSESRLNVSSVFKTVTSKKEERNSDWVPGPVKFQHVFFTFLPALTGDGPAQSIECCCIWKALSLFDLDIATIELCFTAAAVQARQLLPLGLHPSITLNL